MTVSLQQRAPRVRCYKCGSSAVRALCHHCRRPLCADHEVIPPRWAVRLFGGEADGPGLEKAAGRHCDECAHLPLGGWPDVRIAAAALGAICLIALLIGGASGLVIVVCGAVAAGVTAYVLLRQRLVEARAGLPVPLHPKVADLHLIERLRVRIALEPGGRYTVQSDPVDGWVVASLTFGAHDRDRVAGRRRRSGLGPDDEVPYAAGSFVLQGQAGIVGPEDGAVLPIGGDAREVATFAAKDAPASSTLEFTRSYRLSPEPDGLASLWITPSIVPDAERHVLVVDIQWPEVGRDRHNPLGLDTIDVLRINCPVTWGNVEGHNHEMVRVAVGGVAEAGQEIRTLEWEHLTLSDEEREKRCLTMLIQFEHQVEANDNLSGHLEATLDGSLSGADGIRAYNALGEYRNVPDPIRVKTRVEADFSLSLASIRYQAVRVYPDRAGTDGERDTPAGEYGIVPDHRTVIALTNALAGAGYYVKRVLDNPPRSGGRADVVQRYWDIAGRHYQGVYPIDWHLILTGEERHTGDVRPEAGSTNVRIEVRGPFTDDCMFEGVKEAWRNLHDVTDLTLKRQATSGGRTDESGWPA